MNEETIERAVVEMKELYVRLRGLTSRAAGHAAHAEQKWYALAAELLSRGINPRRYIRWAYDFYRRDHPDVYANMITSLKALRAFTSLHEDYEAEMRLAIRLQADTLSKQLELGRSPREIIEDVFLDLGPVFKYALARQHGLARYEEQLRGAAELEMACEPFYRQLVSGLLRSAENAQSVGRTAGYQQSRDAHTHGDLRGPVPGGGPDSG